ncbi:MAG: aspartyl protease family protein [Prevotella sp.]|jgi:hypothetical protein|nr:aspartyl protease family protein [Prevotella sp.]
MKKIAFSLLFILISLNFSAQSADEEVGGYINDNSFFSLNEKYPVLKNKIQSPMLKALSEALLYSLFNHPEQAVASIDVLVRDYQEEMGFDNVKNMLAWQNNILFRMGEYCQAAERANSFLEQVAPHLDAETLDQVRSINRYYNSMCGQKKSELIRPDKDCEIPIYTKVIDLKNFRKGHLLYVPVTIGEKEERFILDTGCPGGVFLSEEYADNLGVKITMDSLRVSGMGGTGWGKMGVLDSLSIGNMTFRNIVATVTPSDPAIDPILKINAVLGSDIMKLAGEVQIYPKDKKIIFPVKKTPLPATGQNLMITGDDLFSVKVYSDKQPLIMHFDTGDSSAGLHYDYYKKHEEYIKKEGKKTTFMTGGFGGVKENEYYILPSFPLRIGDKNFVMKDINVGIDPITIIAGRDGSLGMSFIDLFDKITISFDQMFVEVE